MGTTAGRRKIIQSPTLVVSQPRCAISHAVSEGCSFQVAWEINPHMRRGAVDGARAANQHRLYVERLRRAGAEVIELPFVHGAFDSVFTKDSAVLIDRGDVRFALLSRFADDQRQREQSARFDALKAAGFEVLEVNGPAFEGGDVARLPSGALLMGYGFRTSPAAARLLGRYVDAEVISLRLVDPWLYHLDTALAVLEDGTVLCCREAFDDASFRALWAHPDHNGVVLIPPDEARRFALNFVQIGESVVTGALARLTERTLRSRGLDVRYVPLTEFQLAGGSAACLAGRIYEEVRAARSETTEMRSTSA